MNRRQFTKGLAALGLVPAIPIPAAGAASTAAPASTQFLYPWAAQFARVHNACSPALLAENLKIAPEVAQALHSRLMANGIITAPGLTGVSQAAKPFWAKMRFPGAMVGANSQTTQAANSTKAIDLEKVEEFLDDIVEQVEDPENEGETYDTSST